MSNIKHAVIACAGLGTRLGLNQPKCMIKFSGQPLIYHQLQLLKDVEDVRLIVGYQEDTIMNYVKTIRNDVTFIRNSKYMETSQNYSYWLGIKDLKEPFIMMDADLYITPESFQNFINNCNGKTSTIGYTDTKTENCVYVNILDDEVQHFSRDQKSKFEWCNVAYLNGIEIDPNGKYIYDGLEKKLPLKAQKIEVFEIDTQQDYQMLMNKKSLVTA